MWGQTLSCPVPLPREQPQFSAAPDRRVLRVLVVRGAGDTGIPVAAAGCCESRVLAPRSAGTGAGCEGGRAGSLSVGGHAVALPDGERELPREVQRQRFGVQRPALRQGAGAGPGRVEHGQLGARQPGLQRHGLGQRLRPGAGQARGRLQAMPLGRWRAVVLEPHRLHLLQREGTRVTVGKAAAHPPRCDPPWGAGGLLPGGVSVW